MSAMYKNIILCKWIKLKFITKKCQLPFRKLYYIHICTLKYYTFMYNIHTNNIYIYIIRVERKKIPGKKITKNVIQSINIIRFSEITNSDICF